MVALYSFIAKWPKNSDVLTGPLLFLHTSAIILPTVVIYHLLGVGQLRNICLVQRGMRIRPLIGWDELWLALCSTILVRHRITKGQTNASYTIFFSIHSWVHLQLCSFCGSRQTIWGYVCVMLLLDLWTKAFLISSFFVCEWYEAYGKCLSPFFP